MGNKSRTINRLHTSGTNGTKRDKREILKLDTSGTHGTTPPIGGCPCPAAPGLSKKSLDELVDVLAIVTAGEKLAEDYQALKAEVVYYLDGYTTRGMVAEGRALARLRKAVDR